MAEEKHIVWSDINLDLEDWRDSLTEIYGDASEDFLYEKMCESNEMNFYDERANLNIQLPREIIVIADLGLWNGRFSGYKTIKSGKAVPYKHSKSEKYLRNDLSFTINEDLSNIKLLEVDGDNVKAIDFVNPQTQQNQNSEVSDNEKSEHTENNDENQKDTEHIEES